MQYFPCMLAKNFLMRTSVVQEVQLLELPRTHTAGMYTFVTVKTWCCKDAVQKKAV